jgi:serine/threonine protein kinase
VRHGRPVALKVLRPELAMVLGAERFVAEFRTTAALQHPHILPLFDSGEAAGHLYYVMPFVAGETLRARLTRERQLSVADATRIATEVASALDYAHRRGIVHRDIKPENILLGDDGQALVADFGIALAVSNAGGERITQSGLSVGTPQYMAPEQAAAERAVDARADVYALGAVTYEMLSGEPPFTGASAPVIIAKLMTEEPTALTRYRRHVPPQVDAAVRTAPREDSGRPVPDRWSVRRCAQRVVCCDGERAGRAQSAPTPVLRDGDRARRGNVADRRTGRRRAGPNRIRADPRGVSTRTGAHGHRGGHRPARRRRLA